MIERVYILRKSGVCVYSVDVGDIRKRDTLKSFECLWEKENIPQQEIIKTKRLSELDPFLLSGLFAAIMQFAESLTDTVDSIRNLPMKNLDFYFYMVRNYYFIIETSFLTKPLEVESFMSLCNTVANVFFEYLYINDIPDDYSRVIEDETLTDELKTEIEQFLSRELTKITKSS